MEMVFISQPPMSRRRRGEFRHGISLHLFHRDSSHCGASGDHEACAAGGGRLADAKDKEMPIPLMKPKSSQIVPCYTDGEFIRESARDSRMRLNRGFRIGLPALFSMYARGREYLGPQEL